MSDVKAQLELVRMHWENISTNVERSHDLYHEDAVLEFPQSGERFEGRAIFLDWRLRYPAEVAYRVRRVTVRDGLVVVECSVSYNGGPWVMGVQLLEFRGDRVARERIYVTEPWEAPEWRAPWRSEAPADPPEAGGIDAFERAGKE
jgi:hypothetical protein